MTAADSVACEAVGVAASVYNEDQRGYASCTVYLSRPIAVETTIMTAKTSKDEIWAGRTGMEPHRTARALIDPVPEARTAATVTASAGVQLVPGVAGQTGSLGGRVASETLGVTAPTETEDQRSLARGALVVRDSRAGEACRAAARAPSQHRGRVAAEAAHVAAVGAGQAVRMAERAGITRVLVPSSDT